MHPTQDWMDRINTTQMEIGRLRWQAVTALAHFDKDAGLRGLRQPVMLLLGEHFYYVKFLDEMIARIKDLRHHEVLKDGRFCMTWERATDIAARAKPFIMA